MSDISQAIFESLNTAIILVDEDLRLRQFNPAAEALLSISNERSLGELVTNVFYETPDITLQLKEAALQAKHYTKRHAYWQLVDGQQITVDYTVTPFNPTSQAVPQQPAISPDKLTASDETILLHEAVLLDKVAQADQSVSRNSLIIEIQPIDRLLRISRKEMLNSAQETTRNLVRGMAHEIKNPLGGIRGAAQLLARELPNNVLQEYTQVIIAETDRLRNLVDRMLGPKQLPHFTALNVHQALERVAVIILAECKQLDDQKTITLTRDYDPSIPDLKGDQELLIQALLNIARNAMQSLVEANILTGNIRLRTRIQRQFTIGRRYHLLVCRIDICDNGPGIPLEILGDIFYPMISGRAEGTGLGLAIAQHIIHQHQGLIECHSTPKETCFSLYLPMQLGQAVAD